MHGYSLHYLNAAQCSKLTSINPKEWAAGVLTPPTQLNLKARNYFKINIHVHTRGGQKVDD